MKCISPTHKVQHIHNGNATKDLSDKSVSSPPLNAFYGAVFDGFTPEVLYDPVGTTKATIKLRQTFHVGILDEEFKT